jgi:hypothetical protein
MYETISIKAQDSCTVQYDWKLRNSFQSEDLKSKAAMFTYTKPKNGNESYLIDAALGLQMSWRPDLSMNVFGEYHRNTLVDKAQNTIQGGLASEWYTNSTFNIDASDQNSRTAIINFTAKYSNDIINKVESIQSTGEITVLFTRLNRTNYFLPNVINKIDNFCSILYFPSLGYEWEGRIQSKNDSTKGNIVRAVGKVNISIFPLPICLKSRIELFGDFAYRYDVINSTKYTEYSHPWLQSGVNFVISDDKKIAIKLSCSYNKGANPAQGLKDQEYVLIALTIKI